MSTCKACASALEGAVLGTYCVCRTCRSANYISERSSTDENIHYFDSMYSAAHREIIESRRDEFVKCEQLYRRFHRKADERHQDLLRRFSERICSAGRVVEVGFGFGHELVYFLRRGANIFGIDLSKEAVTHFRSWYPEYAQRVAEVSQWKSRADIVYSNAVFEHLDEPGEFLQRASAILNLEGQLLMRLPLIAQDFYAASGIKRDINFWKPCHRVLYTRKGLTTLLEANGFKIVESAGYAYYGYNVMSAMLQHGYREIETVRDPCVPIARLNSHWMYRMILLHGLVKKTVCVDFAFIAAKEKHGIG